MLCRRATKVSKKWWAEFEKEIRATETADAVVDWFSRKTWDAFHTGTFSRRVSGPYVQRSLSRFLAEPPYSQIVRAALWVSEPHPGGHGSHSHALISLSSDIRSRLWAESRARLPNGSRPWGKRFRPRTASPGPTWTMLYRQWKESWYAKWGRCRLDPVRNQRVMLTRYVMKYVLKAQRPSRNTGTAPPWDRTPLVQQNDTAWGIILRDH